MARRISHPTVPADLQAAFWKTAAALTDLAWRNPSISRPMLRYAPLVLAGAAAFALGRLFGSVLLG